MASESLAAYHVPPDQLEAFPDCERVEGKTRFNAGKIRARWRCPNGKFFEWDYQHGTVERYSKRGVHEGEFDPTTGQMTREAINGRTVEP